MGKESRSGGTMGVVGMVGGCFAAVLSSRKRDIAGMRRARSYRRHSSPLDGRWLGERLHTEKSMWLGFIKQRGLFRMDNRVECRGEFLRDGYRVHGHLTV